MNTTVTRTLSGIVFLAVMIGGLLLGRTATLVLTLFIAGVMLYEFYRITLGDKHRWAQIASIGLVLVSMLLVAAVTGPIGLASRWMALLPGLLTVLLAAMVLHHSDFKDYAYILSGLAYIGLPMVLSPLVPGRLLLYFFVLIWASDTGAYCFGMLFGQKLWPAKLCPSISPKKSWAGALGGMLASLLAAYILYLTGALPYPVVHVLVMAALMNVAGVLGDLFESLWKRQFDVKDSGTIMPGHGGLLDRFDSALMAIPAGYVYLILFNLV